MRTIIERLNNEVAEHEDLNFVEEGLLCRLIFGI